MKNFSKISNELLLWLSVYRTNGIGPKKFWQLFEQNPSLLHAPTTHVDNEINLHLKNNFGLLHAQDPKFPAMLKQLNDYPPVFSYAGNVDLLNSPIIAIVGARNASIGSLKLARKIAHDLNQAGYCIISGLARGIDGAAHHGCVDFKSADGIIRSIGVLAGGIDQIYPPEHKELYKQLCEKGCVISEMPFGAKPSAPLFPKRNRLIASIAQGIIIIEAAEKSGTLITAQYAIDLGKDIFVIPGSPLDPRSRGGNKLIKDGAMLIENAQDVIEYYVNFPTIRKTNPIDRKIISSQDRKDTKKPTTKSQLGDYAQEAPKKAEAHDQHNWLDNIGVEAITMEEAYAIVNANGQKKSYSEFLSYIAGLELDGVITKTRTGNIVKTIHLNTISTDN